MRSFIGGIAGVAVILSSLILMTSVDSFTSSYIPKNNNLNKFGQFISSTTRSMPKATTKSSTLSMAQQQPGVVITGGAAGVGFAYAGEFLNRGYNVVICDVKDCTTAANALKRRYPSGGTVYHTKCDVSNAKDVEKLGQFAVKNLGTIGYWINNAGINGGRRDLREVSISTVEAVVKVNLLGILFCTKIAMEIMGQQTGVTGHIFNTVGSGVKGGGTPGYACYGATKRGLPQLTATLGTCHSSDERKKQRNAPPHYQRLKKSRM